MGGSQIQFCYGYKTSSAYKRYDLTFHIVSPNNKV